MNGYLVGGIAILFALLLGAGYEIRSQHRELAVLESKLEQTQNNGKEDVKYVKEIINVPGATVYRDRVVHGLCIIPGVHREPGADGAARPDATAGLSFDSGRFARVLSEETRGCVLNDIKLDHLHAELRPQVKP